MRILETVLYAEDLIAAHAFYVELLGFTEISYDPERNLFLRADESVLILFRASKTKVPDAGVPPHGAVGQGHVAFEASDTELEGWADKLEAAGVPVTQRKAWPNGAKSIYFEDPAGNVLEFVTPDLWF